MSKTHFIVKGEFAFFYGGCFSQWFPSRFKDGNIQFKCAEQAMMFRKAILFDDLITARRILNADSPKRQKELGRRVSNFDKGKWELVARDIVFKNNILKFKQNPDLLEILKSTGDLLLVEASPYDDIWGIKRGLDYDHLEDTKMWRGTNWLGEVLTNVRNELIKGRV